MTLIECTSLTSDFSVAVLSKAHQSNKKWHIILITSNVTFSYTQIYHINMKIITMFVKKKNLTINIKFITKMLGVILLLLYIVSYNINKNKILPKYRVNITLFCCTT